MSFGLVVKGGVRGGGGEWGGNQHSKTAEEKEVCETLGRRESPELWLPGGHHIFVSLAGSPYPVAGSMSHCDSVDAPQLLPFRLTQTTLKGNL